MTTLKSRIISRGCAIFLALIMLCSSCCAQAETDVSSFFSQWSQKIGETDFTTSAYQIELSDQALQNAGSVTFQQAEDGLQVNVSYGGMEIPLRFTENQLVIWLNDTPYTIDYLSLCNSIKSVMFPNSSETLEDYLALASAISEFAADLWQYVQDYGAIQFDYEAFRYNNFSIHFSADATLLADAIYTYFYDMMEFQSDTFNAFYQKYGQWISSFLGISTPESCQKWFGMLYTQFIRPLKYIDESAKTIHIDFVKKNSIIQLSIDNQTAHLGSYDLSYFSFSLLLEQVQGFWKGSGQLIITSHYGKETRTEWEIEESRDTQNNTEFLTVSGNVFYDSVKRADFSGHFDLDQTALCMQTDIHCYDCYGQQWNHIAISGNFTLGYDGMQFSCTSLSSDKAFPSFRCNGKWGGYENEFYLNSSDCDIAFYINYGYGNFKANGRIKTRETCTTWNNGLGISFDITSMYSKTDANIRLLAGYLQLHVEPQSLMLEGKYYQDQYNLEFSGNDSTSLFGSGANWSLIGKYNTAKVFYSLESAPNSVVLKYNNTQVLSAKMTQPRDAKLIFTLEAGENETLCQIENLITDKSFIQMISGKDIDFYVLTHKIFPAEKLDAVKEADCKQLTAENAFSTIVIGLMASANGTQSDAEVPETTDSNLYHQN